MLGATLITSVPRHNRKRRISRRGRVGLLTFVFAGCLLCAWLGVWAAHPFLAAKRWRDGNDDLERALQETRLHNQHERTEIRALQTEAGVLQKAREMGYVRPGERRLHIPGS